MLTLSLPWPTRCWGQPVAPEWYRCFVAGCGQSTNAGSAKGRGVRDGIARQESRKGHSVGFHRGVGRCED